VLLNAECFPEMTTKATLRVERKAADDAARQPAEADEDSEGQSPPTATSAQEEQTALLTAGATATAEPTPEVPPVPVPLTDFSPVVEAADEGGTFMPGQMLVSADGRQMWVGDLTKMGGVRHNWLERRFVLLPGVARQGMTGWFTPPKLEYYAKRSADLFGSDDAPKGEKIAGIPDKSLWDLKGDIDLDGNTRVRTSTAPKATDMEIEVATDERTYRVRTHSRQDHANWMHKLREACAARAANHGTGGAVTNRAAFAHNMYVPARERGVLPRERAAPVTPVARRTPAPARQRTGGGQARDEHVNVVDVAMHVVGEMVGGVLVLGGVLLRDVIVEGAVKVVTG
jgi:hypothetical protein